MNFFLIIFPIIAILTGSCSSINKGHLNSNLKISIESNMNASINVDTSQKLTGYASGIYLFHLFKISGDSKYADDIEFNEGKAGTFEQLFSNTYPVKAAAAYNAIRTSKADVIIAPQYVIESNNWNPFYKEVKVKVTGYPGYIVSIRNK